MQEKKENRADIKIRIITMIPMLLFIIAFLFGGVVHGKNYSYAELTEKIGKASIPYGVSETALKENGEEDYRTSYEDDCQTIIILDEDSPYYGYTFQYYKTSFAAKRIFAQDKAEQNMAENVEIVSKGNSGWISGITDGSVKQFEYIHRNVIIRLSTESDFEKKQEDILQNW